jgi:hypothetical protein
VNGSFGSESIALANLVNPILQFGTWATGSTTTLTRTLGGSSGTGYGIFYAGSSGCVERSGPCNVSVAFSVSGTGLLQTDLVATNQVINSPPYPSVTFLEEATGVAAGPMMTFDMPDGIAEPVGEGGHAYRVNAYNSGTTAMTISNIAMSGADAGDFTPAATCVGALAVGGHCEVSIPVIAGNVGLRTATLTLTDGISGQSFSVPMSVLGLPAAPVFSPTTATFPVTAVNDISAPMSFTVTAYNNAALTAVLQGSGQPSEFALTKASCAQGESPCIITGVFHPTSVGNAMAYVAVTDSRGIQGVAMLSGYGGVGPIGTVSSASVTFASRPAGSTSVAQTVTVTNTGDEPFFPVVSAVSGTNASEFLVSNSCSGFLAAGSNCVISVTFNPTAAGSKSASFQVNGNVNGINAAGLPVTISLSGSAF